MVTTITRWTAPLLVAGLIAVAPGASSEPAPAAIAYTISMPQPSNHRFIEHANSSASSFNGASLTDVLECASTTRDVDYARYFGYAGLDVTATSEDAPSSYLGLNTQTRDGRLMVVSTSAGSPAEQAGLAVGDQLVEVDGAPASSKVINDTLSARKPGDSITVKISRNNAGRELQITLARNTKQTFTIRPVNSPTALQKAILEDWLRRAR